MFLLPLAGENARESMPRARGELPPRPLNWIWVYDGHWLLQLMLYLLAAALAAWALRPPRWQVFAVAAALAALNFEPFFETLFGLQVETLMLLLLAICLIALQRGRDPVAGVGLAVCGMLKIYPAFLLLYLLVKRRWAAIGWCAGASLLIAVACGSSWSSGTCRWTLPAATWESVASPTGSTATRRVGCCDSRTRALRPAEMASSLWRAAQESVAPSTRISSPLMWAASSEARKAIRLATVSGPRG